MINQGAPTHENKVNGIAALKSMSDYGKSKGIIVSVETRATLGGNRAGGPGRGPAASGAPAPAATGVVAPPAATVAPAAPATPPPPAMPQPEVWALLSELITGAAAAANVDVGGAGAANQEELHQCLKLLMPRTAGSLHTRVNPRWDLATAMRFLEHDLNYKGLYTIEAANGHEGTQQIYDVVVATL